MSTIRDPEELAVALAEAEELSRQRALVLELQETRLLYRLERELEARRKRERRAADLLRLADALAHSDVGQRDYVLQPKETVIESEPDPHEPATKRVKG